MQSAELGCGRLERPIVHILVVSAAAAPEEEAIRRRQVVVEAQAEQMAHGDAWLRATKVVAGRLLSLFNEILIGARHCGRVKAEQLVPLRSVGLENAIARSE